MIFKIKKYATINSKIYYIKVYIIPPMVTLKN